MIDTDEELLDRIITSKGYDLEPLPGAGPTIGMVAKCIAKAYHAEKSKHHPASEYREEMGDVLWTNPNDSAGFRQRYFGNPPTIHNGKFIYYGIIYTHFSIIQFPEID